MIDLTELDLPHYICLEPEGTRVVHVTINPQSGPYMRGTFRFSITYPLTYPFYPPRVRCLERVFHPNITPEGAVCLNILRLDWSPALSTQVVIWGLVLVLEEPNAEEPLNQAAGELLEKDPKEFQRVVDCTMCGGTYGKVSFDNILRP